MVFVVFFFESSDLAERHGRADRALAAVPVVDARQGRGAADAVPLGAVDRRDRELDREAGGRRRAQ